MTISRVLTFDDPSVCETVFPSENVELFPTTSGKFRAAITQVGMNGMWMQRIHISLPEINTVAVKPGSKSFGFLTERNASALVHCGREVVPGDIVINRSDVVYQRSGHELHYGTISLPSADLAAAAEAMIGHELPETTSKLTVRPPAELMVRLQNIHKSIGQFARCSPNILSIAEVGRAIENELIHTLMRCLADGHSLEPTARSVRHEKIVSRFVQFLEANSDRPFYLAEICAAIGVGERTLRASCEEHMGMGPIRFLALRRMHLVRRALQRADGPGSTVTRILTDHGFWELGRFASSYRALFGESPSATLRSSRSAVSSPAKPWQHRVEITKTRAAPHLREGKQETNHAEDHCHLHQQSAACGPSQPGRVLEGASSRPNAQQFNTERFRNTFLKSPPAFEDAGTA